MCRHQVEQDEGQIDFPTSMWQTKFMQTTVQIKWGTPMFWTTLAVMEVGGSLFSDEVRKTPTDFDFVRGDDIEFSIANEFEITTLNGIASWCEVCAQKRKPPVIYLHRRAELFIVCLHASRERIMKRLKRTLQKAWRAGRVFDYENMEALIAAVQDVLKGPSFSVKTMLHSPGTPNFEVILTGNGRKTKTLHG